MRRLKGTRMGPVMWWNAKLRVRIEGDSAQVWQMRSYLRELSLEVERTMLMGLWRTKRHLVGW